MTAAVHFESHDIEMLLSALATHREHLRKIYDKPGVNNQDWWNRDKQLRALQSKLIQAKT